MLVAPLDWGLGHATRCIPIINALIASGYSVTLAAEGAQASLLQTEFPALPLLFLPGYRIRYSKQKWSLPFVLLLQLPRLLWIIRKERRWLNKMINQHQFNLVISDNRYGLSTEKVSCIFITHQLTIRMPVAWVEKLVQKINFNFINRFDACWVPDLEGSEQIAGILSHPEKFPKTNVFYIGPLVRFEERDEINKYGYCILLSGPEPQRSLLEKKLVEGFGMIREKILLVRGKPGSDEVLMVPDHVTVYNHLPTDQLQTAILQSNYIICRSGYTTLMELLSLKKKMLLIPTPGQTEQEYLAELLLEKKYALAVVQNRFNCEEHFKLMKEFEYSLPDLKIFNKKNIAPLLQQMNSNA